MFPGMGNMNPKQMQGMLKQFGIKTEEIKAKKVTIETENGKIVFEEPNVTVLDMKGQKIFSIIGNPIEEKKESKLDISEDDIELVAKQAKTSKEKAKKALEKTKGDIAEAIELLEK